MQVLALETLKPEPRGDRHISVEEAFSELGSVQLTREEVGAEMGAFLSLWLSPSYLSKPTFQAA